MMKVNKRSFNNIERRAAERRHMYMRKLFRDCYCASLVIPIPDVDEVTCDGGGGGHGG
jgi:hypothetical protein